MVEFCFDNVLVIETTGGKLKGDFYKGEWRVEK